MGNLLTIKYWFNFRPEALDPTLQNFFIIILVALLLITIVLGYIKSRQKKNIYSRLWQSIYYFFLTNTIIGYILMFFTYEMVPFLSARFWFLLWIILDLVWLYFIFRVIISIPQKKTQLEKEKEFRKYIP